jgi:hypothetical protein
MVRILHPQYKHRADVVKSLERFDIKCKFYDIALTPNDAIRILRLTLDGTSGL